MSKATRATGSRPPRGAALALRAVDAPVGYLEEMGRQFHFYTHTVASIPRTIRRYRKETIRLLAEVSMGTGALAVIGGTLVVVAFSRPRWATRSASRE